MSTTHQYGEAFRLWREATETTWRDYTRHAFVEGLCDGSLPRTSFIHYMVQDYVYLIHFSRAWALAVAKADTLDEMKACAASVNALVNGEMQLHIETCASEGISKDALESAVEEAENLAYTRYVLEAGYSGDFLDLMAALAPCVMGYGEIGTRLKAEQTSDTYTDWIDTYAGDEYQENCMQVGQLIDQALASRLGTNYATSPKWTTLTQKFETATRLEVGFWDMGLRGA